MKQESISERESYDIGTPIDDTSIKSAGNGKNERFVVKFVEKEYHIGGGETVLAADLIDYNALWEKVKSDKRINFSVTNNIVEGYNHRLKQIMKF